jgi:hypothetical protein
MRAEPPISAIASSASSSLNLADIAQSADNRGLASSPDRFLVSASSQLK